MSLKHLAPPLSQRYRFHASVLMTALDQRQQV